MQSLFICNHTEVIYYQELEVKRIIIIFMPALWYWGCGREGGGAPCLGALGGKDIQKMFF